MAKKAESPSDWVTDAFEGAGYTCSVFASTVLAFGGILNRRRELLYHVYAFGCGALPVTVLVAIFTGMVVTFQTGLALYRIGQASQVGVLVPLAMCREMGPVMTCNILAGLLGSRIAAEIGTMNVSEEIDALRVMSINPIDYLVMPRFLAMCIVCPMLTLYADFIGIIAGALVARTQLDVSTQAYLSNAREVLEFRDIYSGLLKALVFGALTAAVACSQGLRTEKGAEGVGVATMRTVVISSVLILVSDYILGWFCNVFLGVGA
ncbi:MAG: ABC transporter permease [Planctomycetes bacterium]|nr:ABC transporter permease [Planctomycetota bacterium]